jgi:hypothetical protein
MNVATATIGSPGPSTVERPCSTSGRVPSRHRPPSVPPNGHRPEPGAGITLHDQIPVLKTEGAR